VNKYVARFALSQFFDLLSRGSFLIDVHFLKQEYFQALNLQEIAENELKTLTQQYEHSKEKLAKYKQENHKAIELYNEQMNILSKYSQTALIHKLRIEQEIVFVFQTRHLTAITEVIWRTRWKERSNR
jgi:hypothetical protein